MQVGLSDVIAVLALALSAYATWITSRFNRRQESLIAGQEKLNEVLLQKELTESVAADHADLGASFIKLGQGNHRLKVFNRGKSAARNVMIEFPDGNSLIIQSEIEDKFPLEVLEPQQAVELVAAVAMGSPRKLPVKLTWSDAQGERNHKLVYPTL
jgi:hypothetical protein